MVVLVGQAGIPQVLEQAQGMPLVDWPVWPGDQFHHDDRGDLAGGVASILAALVVSSVRRRIRASRLAHISARWVLLIISE